MPTGVDFFFFFYIALLVTQSVWTVLQTRELLQELLQMDPANARGLGLLGSLELTLGHHDLARRHFTTGLESDPELVSNLHSLARLELLEGNVAEARALFQKGLGIEPKNVYILQVRLRL